MEVLQIHVLGAPRLVRGGEDIPISRRKTVALLAYLAVTGQTHQRDTLATMFWPENDQSGARANLRRELSRLNKALGEDVLDVDRQQVGINPEVETWLDVAAFEAKLSEAARHDHHELCAECAPALAEAVDLYRGDFLAGFSLEDSPAFDEWQFFQAEGLRQGLADALAKLVSWHDSRTEFERAVEYARRWVALDPLHEPAQRELMRQYALAGQMAAATRQFQEFARLLREELDVEPEPETTKLFEAIRTRRFPPGEERAVEGGEPEAHDVSRRALKQEIRFCTSYDGTRIAYALTGSGPPFVKAANYLAHLEFDLNSPVWRHWLGGLSRHHTLVRYDERGNGLSDWDADELSVEAFTRDLEAVVEAEELKRFPLLGVSQGGPVAISYAIRHPERVSHLILYGSYMLGRLKRPYAPEDVEQAEAMLKVMEVGWGQENPAFRQLFTSLFLPEGSPEQVDWFNELQRVTTSPQNAIRLEKTFMNIDVSNVVDQVNVPTLVLHGDEDAVIPFAEGQRLAARIPGAKFVPLESKNHLLLETEPAWERFLSEVYQFVGVGG